MAEDERKPLDLMEALKESLQTRHIVIAGEYQAVRMLARVMAWNMSNVFHVHSAEQLHGFRDVKALFMPHAFTGLHGWQQLKVIRDVAARQNIELIGE